MLASKKAAAIKGLVPARASKPFVATRAVADKKGLRPELVVLAPLVLAQPALAQEGTGDEVDTAVDIAINAVKATGDVVRGTLSAVQSGIQVLKEGYDAAAPVVGSAVKTAAPVVQQVVKTAADVATPAIQSALPALKDAGKVLESTGLSTDTVRGATSVVTSATSTAVTTATPLVQRLINFLTTTDPVLVAEYALGLLALGYITPGLLGLVFGSFRGYAGELAAAAALDLLVNDSGAALVDIRTAKEKEGSGVPDLPSAANGKSVEVEYAVTEDKKLRNSLRDPTSIESQITALQIASLKRLGKGSKIILLDKNGGSARAVAKELARKGYSKVYIIQGGFDGRGGWVNSKLQIKPAANIVSTAPPSIAKTVFTRSKALPAPRG